MKDTEKVMSSYAAIIAPIKTRPHPGADRLQLGTTAGCQVVVGLDTADETLGVMFLEGGQLSHQMCVANSLYSESAAKDLGLTQTKFGFFSTRRRVRSQKFRGERSDGFWTELSSLAWTGADINLLNAGDQFTELNGQAICNKYFTPATLRAMAHEARQGRKQPDAVFPRHPDTAQFRYAIGHLPHDSIVYVSEKMHGTSARFGHVREHVTMPPWKRLLGRLVSALTGATCTLDRWAYLNGSRNVTLNDERPGYYGSNAFRYDVVKGVTLHKGEILYGEIVGDVGPGEPVMQEQTIQDKALVKQYGDVMRYRYGCPDGVHRLYVYKITRLNEDGIETELPWSQVVGRCAQLSVDTVRLLAPPFVYRDERDTEALVSLVESLTEGPSTFDPRHIREGVVVRVESAGGITNYKSKGFAFGVLEGYIRDDDTAVDLEEAA